MSTVKKITQEFDYDEISLFEMAQSRKDLFDDGDWIESEHITDDGIRLIQTGNIGIGRFIEKEIKKFIFDQSFEKLKCKALRAGDLLVCRLAEPAGRACVLPDIGFDRIVTSVDVTIFRPPADVANRQFLANLFSTEDWFRIVRDRSGGTTHKRIARGALGKIRVKLPDIETQNAIAEVLTDADALIESLENLIAKKRAIKQGAMQELLSGARRLAGFTGKWENKSLGSICEVVNGLTYSPNDVRENGVLVLRSSNIQNDALSFDSNVFVDMDVPTKCLVETNDILICVRNGSRDLIGKCVKLDERCKGMAFGAFMAILRTPLHGFILQQFRSDDMKKQIVERLGATINQITNSSLKFFLVPVPPTDDEANAIASVLSDLDEEIDTLVSRLTKARQIKQGMMQDLLTGKVRLV